jgi:hypothetical protein
MRVPTCRALLVLDLLVITVIDTLLLTCSVLLLGSGTPQIRSCQMLCTPTEVAGSDPAAGNTAQSDACDGHRRHLTLLLVCY